MPQSQKTDGECIAENVDSQESKVYAAKKLSRFFEIEIKISIFGNEIFRWVFPPDKTNR